MAGIRNSLITGAFAAAMAAAGSPPQWPRKRRKTSAYAVAQTQLAMHGVEARKQAAEEKRRRKAAKLEAEAARGGLRRAP